MILILLEVTTVVLHAKTTGGVYSPAETCYSSPKVAALHTQNHR